jgi:hypothetical protein
MSYLSKLYRSERQLNKEDHGLKDVPAVVRNQLLALFTVRAEVCAEAMSTDRL